jgi:hypothetical protein
MTIQSSIESAGSKGSENFRNDGLKNKGRNFMAGYGGQGRPFLIPDMGSKRGTVEMDRGTATSCGSNALDTPVVEEGLHVVPNFFLVLTYKARDFDHRCFAFIEDRQGINPDRMLEHINDQLIDPPRFRLRCWVHRQTSLEIWILIVGVVFRLMDRSVLGTADCPEKAGN